MIWEEEKTMREILFRGKRMDNGEWGEGFLARTTLGSTIIVNEVEEYSCGCCIGIGSANFEVDPSTVGQYTGLKDKNGKRIFEGDIVRCVSKTDIANMVVIFEDGEFRMVLCGKYKEYTPGCGFYAIRCFDKQVIGNVHENQGLLEESGL